jgi:hypothetical protein
MEPTHCDTCARPLCFSGMMFDCRIPNMGWGILCVRCFLDFGCKVGTGLGQKYVLGEPGDKKWTPVSVH